MVVTARVRRTWQCHDRGEHDHDAQCFEPLPAIAYVANPAAIGAEWSEDGTTWQLAVIRTDSPRTVLFGSRGHTQTVVNPERFGPIPTDRATMLAYAERFLAGDES